MEEQSELNLTTKEEDYLKRLIKVAEERIENLNLSFGIIIEQHAEKYKISPCSQNDKFTENDFLQDHQLVF